MPATLVESGTQTCTLATDHNLGAADLVGPAGGAHYALVLDLSNIVGEERLFAYWRREVIPEDTTPLLMERMLVGAGVAALPAVEVGLLRLPADCVGRFGIRQEGGTGRAVRWSIERVDG